MTGVPSVMDVADVLLAAAVQRPTLAVIVEPGARGHEVLVETAEGISHALTLDTTLGDAVVARGALVVGLDVAASAGQPGPAPRPGGGRGGPGWGWGAAWTGRPGGDSWAGPPSRWGERRGSWSR